MLAWMLGALALRIAAAQGVSGGDFHYVPREVELRPEAVPYELEATVWNLDKTNAPFLKEPETSPHYVFRSRLPFGKDTNDAIALIWDQPKHKLYLDLNRNLDLTDDPTGTFSSTGKGFQQVFTNVTLPLQTASGLLPAILDLHLFTDPQANWAQVQLHSHSLWQAKVVLEGEAWQVAALDNLFGQAGPTAATFLLLRPWGAATNRVSFYDLASGIVPFPNRLFWLGRAYQLDRHFDTNGATPVCKLEFTPQQPEMTELRLSGEFLYYTVLRDSNGYTAVLREPPGTVRVPQGIYMVSAAWVKKGPTEAFRLFGQPLVVKATTATNLVLGGPLTNSVALNRSGRKLLMNYQLKGADGGSYRLAQQDLTKPPEFTVFRGGRKALSGRFQFG